MRPTKPAVRGGKRRVEGIADEGYLTASGRDVLCRRSPRVRPSLGAGGEGSSRAERRPVAEVARLEVAHHEDPLAQALLGRERNRQAGDDAPRAALFAGVDA